MSQRHGLSTTRPSAGPTYPCPECGRVLQARIGLISHLLTQRSTKRDIIIIITEEVSVIIGNDGRTTSTKHIFYEFIFLCTVRSRTVQHNGKYRHCREGYAGSIRQRVRKWMMSPGYHQTAKQIYHQFASLIFITRAYLC